MPVTVNKDVNIGSVLTQVSAANFRFGFEQQFSQIQNTTVKRINSEIDKVIRNDTTPQRLAALERDYGKLEKNKALIDSFSFDMRSNQLRLEQMKTKVADAIAAFSAVDADTNLTADEVTALSTRRDQLIEDVSALSLSIHPEISTPFVIRDIKNMYETLKGMSPVAGVVDASGAPTTNGNRQILDDLTSLSTLIDTAYEVTNTTAETATDITLNISAAMAGKVSDMTLLSNVELARREEEIAGIKSKYGNILRVISLSFEARISYMEQSNKSLEGWKVEPGSIMNLFA